MAYDYVKEWAKYLRSEWGLDSEFSIPAAKVYLYLYIYRCNPIITSGYRSIEKQRQLVEAYKKGTPGILTPNPPGKSLHNRTNWLGKPASWAIDIDHDNNEIANAIAKYLGLFWAGPKDWVHFAVRGGYL